MVDSPYFTVSVYAVYKLSGTTMVVQWWYNGAAMVTGRMIINFGDESGS